MPLDVALTSAEGGESAADENNDANSAVGEARLSSALLLEASEIENRLRTHVLELLEPTIRKQRIQDGRLRETKSSLDEQIEEIKSLKKIQEGNESLCSMVEGFRCELAEWDKDRRSHEQQVGDRLSMQEVEISALRSSIEKKAAESSSLSRTLKGLGDMVAVAKEETTELRKFVYERLDLNRDKIEKLRDEFESQKISLGTEQHKLQDNQTRTTTIIGHMKSENERMSQNVEEAVEGVADLWRSKASVGCVEEQQQEFSEFARQVSAHVSGLRQQFGGLVDDVKAHFQTAAQVVATSTAHQVDTMRENYKYEVQRVDAILKEIDLFTATQQNKQTEILQAVDKARKENGADVTSLQETLQKDSKTRSAECASLGVEVQVARRRLKEIEEANHGVDQHRNTFIDVLSAICESLRMSTALDVQDDMDKKNIALYGYKAGQGGPDKGGQSASATKLPKIGSRNGSQSARGPQSAGSARAGDTGGLMTLDKRCLSCSASAQTVLAGFKLACLEYAPSPIEYQKAIYSRSEIIQLRSNILAQATQQMNIIA